MTRGQKGQYHPRPPFSPRAVLHVRGALPRNISLLSTSDAPFEAPMNPQSRQAAMALSTLLLLTAGAIAQACSTDPLAPPASNIQGRHALNEPLKAGWRP
jgi:hypothetical protein